LRPTSNAQVNDREREALFQFRNDAPDDAQKGFNTRSNLLSGF